MAVSLSDYIGLGQPEINGVPIGEAGEFYFSGEDFKYKPTLEEAEHCARIFTDTLPMGRLWEAFGVAGTINWAFSVAVGEMIAIILAYSAYIRRELSPATTVDMIQEWEESVGLPDPCSLQAGLDIDGRRKNVMIRLRRTPIVLSSEIEEACLNLTGRNVKIVPRSALGLDAKMDTGLLDKAMFGGGHRSRFVFDVFVDYIDNSAFGDGVMDTQILDTSERWPRIIECVINKLKPANSIGFYKYNQALYQEHAGT